MAIIGLFTLLLFVGVALGVGAGTVMLAQSLAAAKDGFVSKDETSMLYVVMVVSRVAVFMLFLSHAVISGILYTTYGVAEFYAQFNTVQHSITWVLVSVIFTTNVFIDYRVVTRITGTSILVATWYALLFALVWPLYVPIQVDAFMLAFVIFAVTTHYCVKRSHLFTVSGKKTHKIS